MNKTIIFDLDGTLYDLKSVMPMVYENQVNFYAQKKNINKEMVEQIFQKESIFPYLCSDSKSATEFFSKEGIEMEEWANFREKNFDIGAINCDESVKPQTMMCFSRTFKLILLSSNSYNLICAILSRLNIDRDIFSTIICSNRWKYPGVFNKRLVIKEIVGDSPRESFISIGDRYNTDIKPALDEGIMGIQIKRPDALSEVYRYLTNNVDVCSDGFVIFQ